MIQSLHYLIGPWITTHYPRKNKRRVPLLSEPGGHTLVLSGVPAHITLFKTQNPRLESHFS
ncbi:MAG: hypothetical protein ACFFCM_18950 [Promethearchaeota archaeon]